MEIPQGKKGDDIFYKIIEFIEFFWTCGFSYALNVERMDLDIFSCLHMLYIHGSISGDNMMDGLIVWRQAYRLERYLWDTFYMIENCL